MLDLPAAPTAAAPTLAVTPDTGNVTTAGKADRTGIRYTVASIKIQMARRYLQDLHEFFAGDAGRFTRMVVDGGKALPTAHPRGWALHCLSMLDHADLSLYFKEEALTIRAQLATWHLV